MTFDRLVYIDRLKLAGVDEVIARAHAEGLRDALLESVATKADIAELAAATKADCAALAGDISALAAATKADISALATATKADCAALAGDISTLAAATKADYREFSMEFDRKLEALERKFDAKIEKLDHKIELFARDLVIKGASGLVILVSVMIGLKFIG